MKKILVLFFLCPTLLFSQKKHLVTDDIRDATAEYAFAEGNYLQALPFFRELHEKYPKNLNYKYKLGICYLYKPDEHEKAIPLLEQVYEEAPKIKDILYNLGRAYHANYKFDEALNYFNKYLDEKLPSDQEQLTRQYIEHSNNAKNYYNNPIETEIVNFGIPVNTEASEYVPVLSADETVLIFTYRGERSTGGLMDLNYEPDPFGQYFEDVFISYKINGEWTEPESIGDNINSRGHDAAIALSADGQKLFTYKNTLEDEGDIYISYLEGTTWTTPEPLKGGINTKTWEGSCSLSSDEKTLYFSSERPGGYGGKDLYKATLQEDGSWGNIENLGDNFNTEHDEDAPYIHPDGTIFHFSSNGKNSMGGYDIFKCVLQDGLWTAPENVGYPINTVNNDIYYVISADGGKGFYSTGKSGGYGMQDLYVVSPGIQGKKPVLMLVNGVVTLNDVPVEAKIEVTYESNNNTHGTFESNSATGKYLFNLPSGTNYNISYKLNGFEDQSKTINAAEIDTFTQNTIDIAFYTPDYVKPQAQEEVIPPPAPTPDKVYTYQMYIDEFGDVTAPDLTFKVQIAAYRMPDNYRYEHLQGLGRPEKLVLDDDITRFTLGNFKTLKEADEFKKTVIDKGQTDAFVTAIYNNRRVYLKELYLDILKSAIPERE